MFWRSVCAWIKTWKIQVQSSLGLSALHDESFCFCYLWGQWRIFRLNSSALNPCMLSWKWASVRTWSANKDYWQSGLAPVLVRVKKPVPAVESRIQLSNCQSDGLCLCGIFLTFWIVPPTVVVVGFQGEGWKQQGQPARGTKTGWVTRTQGLVTRRDLAAKRKASFCLGYFLSHAVEAGEQLEGCYSLTVTSSLPQWPGRTSLLMKSPASLCCLPFVLV